MADKDKSKAPEGQPLATEEEASSGFAGSSRDTADENMPEQPSTSELKEADKVAGPYTGDAEANDPPVRTNRPDVPVLESLKVGAGAHLPNTDPEIDAAGRFVGEQPEEETPAAARSTRTGSSSSSSASGGSGS
jgi:hypothetical protein